MTVNKSKLKTMCGNNLQIYKPQKVPHLELISQPVVLPLHPFQRETQISTERAQMMKKLWISHGKLLCWLNHLPANQWDGEHEPLIPDWCSPPSSREGQLQNSTNTTAITQKGWITGEAKPGRGDPNLLKKLLWIMKIRDQKILLLPWKVC